MSFWLFALLHLSSSEVLSTVYSTEITTNCAFESIYPNFFTVNATIATDGPIFPIVP